MKHIILLFLGFLCSIFLFSQDSLKSYKFYKKGRKYYTLMKYEKALKWYQKALRADSNNYFLYNELGLTKKHLGDLKAAVDFFSYGIEKDSNLYEAYENRGNTLSDLGFHKKAIDDLNIVILNNGANSNNLNNRAIIRSELKDWEGAVADYSRAIQIDPYNADAYNNRGVNYEWMDSVNLAIQDYKMAIYIDSTYAEPYYNLAVLQISSKQLYHFAIENLKRALKLDFKDYYPESEIDIHYHLAFAYHYLNDYENAIKHYSSAIDLRSENDSMHSELLFARGTAYAEINKLDKALNDYQETLQVDSLFLGVRTNRALYIYDQRGEYDKAIHDLEEEIRIRSVLDSAASPYDVNNLGYLYHKEGNSERGIKLVRKSISMDSTNSYAYRNLALILMTLQKREEACEAANKSVELGFQELYGDEIIYIKRDACDE